MGPELASTIRVETTAYLHNMNLGFLTPLPFCKWFATSPESLSLRADVWLRLGSLLQ